MKRVSLLFVTLLLVVGMVGCGAKEEGAASSAAVESGAVVAAQEKAESSGASVGAGAEAQGKVDGAQEVLASVASGEEVGKAVTDGAESKGENGAEAVAGQEAVVYEGIDMESTLPGKDWVKTFWGIIEEPKFVVFNDETNKKVIVEDGGEVDFVN